MTIGGREQTVTEFSGRKLQIVTRPRQRISIDGELSKKTPVTASVARAAVWVAAPREEEVSQAG